MRRTRKETNSLLGLPILTVLLFLAFSVSLFYLGKHLKEFRGGSEVYGGILGLFVLGGVAAQISFYGAIWWFFGLLAMVVLLATSIAFTISFSVLEVLLRIPLRVIYSVCWFTTPLFGVACWWSLLPVA